LFQHRDDRERDAVVCQMTLRHMQTAAGEKPGAGHHSCHSCFVYTRIEIVVYSLTTAGASTTRLLLPVSISPGKRSPYRSCRLASKIRQRRTSSAGSCVKTGGCAPCASTLLFSPSLSFSLCHSVAPSIMYYIRHPLFFRSPRSAQGESYRFVQRELFG
jgi:hypothetical protein